MPNSLVTGGAGFIGSHLVESLVARGDVVRVLDNLSTGKLENLRGTLDRIDFIEGDIRKPEDLVRALQGVDLVFHQAAFVSVPLSVKEPDICLETNVIGTQQVLEFSRKAGVKRVILASSAAVYGEISEFPLSESGKTDPLSPYASSKYIAEIYAQMYTHQLGLDVVALRYFNIYGPRQNPESEYAAVIPKFIKQLIDEKSPVVYGDGKQSRDFIFISDVVQANLLAGSVNGAPGKVINICSGQEISLLDLLDKLSDIFKRKIDPTFESPRTGDIYRSLGDPLLAYKLLKFKPKTSIEEGLQATIDWMISS